MMTDEFVEEVRNEILKRWKFCPPISLLKTMLDSFMSDDFPYFETPERETLLNEIAIYLGFNEYPVNMNYTKEFGLEFEKKLREVIESENWETRVVG